MEIPLSKSTKSQTGMDESAETIFEDQFREYWDSVLSVVCRLVGDAAEAEDITLDVFWRFYKSPPRFNTDQELRAWLFRVGTNLGYNALRSRRRRRSYETTSGTQDLDVPRSEDPSQESQRNEERDTVRQVLGTMKRRQALLLTLRYSGFSYAEIAAVLRLSPSSIGQLLSRAEVEFEKRYRKVEGLGHEPPE
jgi:RNA polymerase sigma-70 factor, ECF subfamily